MLLIPAAEEDALVTWVKSTGHDDDVVVDNSTHTLLSIKSLTIHQMSCAVLWLSVFTIKCLDARRNQRK
jgi:hypothetical protein